MNNEIVLAAYGTFELRAVEYYISGGTEMNWVGRVVYSDGETIELYPITVISQITDSHEWYAYHNGDSAEYVFALSKAFPTSDIEILDVVDIKNRRRITSKEEQLALYLSNIAEKEPNRH